MPCRDYRDLLADQLTDSEKKVDKLTRMLCEICGKVATHNYNSTPAFELSEELRLWWKVHKEQDDKRIAEDNAVEKERIRLCQLRISALAKLTVEEKRVLGLAVDFTTGLM